ncbi:PspA/IM30 family protein [Paenibacillus camerounensis]|uniref:PspA/IM30 family protein n=1 Tax=Paenibacillus camerounensis TaxID=1243663 RepID=UPI0005A97E52|nr:PspA/IM30 family protein [Paenibacillus camerounensis]
MSSIFERITTLTKAAIHEGLNKLEDPVLLTGQYLRDLDDKISSAESKQRELKVTASVLERRKAEYLVQADSSEASAIQAMSEGNEPAARVAVEAKLRYLESVQETEVILEETLQALAALEVNLQNAKAEHARLKAKRAELAERARKAAEANKRAAQNSADSYGGAPVYGHVINAGTASRGFERMEDKINEWEAQAGHAAQTSAPAIDPALQGAVEAELARLRSKQTDSGK